MSQLHLTHKGGGSDVTEVAVGGITAIFAGGGGGGSVYDVGLTDRSS